MARLISTGGCCGFRELAGLSCHKTPSDALAYIIQESELEDHTKRKFRFIMFSQAQVGSPFNVKEGYGFNLANMIREKNFGSLVETEWEENPNTLNWIKLWIWGVNWDNLLEWWAEYSKDLPKKDKSQRESLFRAVPVPPPPPVDGYTYVNPHVPEYFLAQQREQRRPDIPPCNCDRCTGTGRPRSRYSSIWREYLWDTGELR